MLELKVAKWTGFLMSLLTTERRCEPNTFPNNLILAEKNFIELNKYTDHIKVGASSIYKEDEDCYIITNYSQMREELRNLVNTVSQDFRDDNVKIICKETLTKLTDFAEVLGENAVVGHYNGDK
jgi:hypothetical protein